MRNLDDYFQWNIQNLVSFIIHVNVKDSQGSRRNLVWSNEASAISDVAKGGEWGRSRNGGFLKMFQNLRLFARAEKKEMVYHGTQIQMKGKCRIKTDIHMENSPVWLNQAPQDHRHIIVFC